MPSTDLTTAAVPTPFWSRQDVARYLAVSTVTVARSECDRSAGFPPPLRFGRVVRYDAAEVQAWVEGRREAARASVVPPAFGPGEVPPEMLPECLRPRTRGRRAA